MFCELFAYTVFAMKNLDMKDHRLQSRVQNTTVQNFEQKTSRYMHLVENLPLSLRFTPSLEKDYQRDLSRMLLENWQMLVGGIVCYALFFGVDYFFYPQEFVKASLLRLLAVVLLVVFLWLGYKLRERVHILNLIALSSVVVGLQIVISSGFYEAPTNQAYLMGMLPLFVFTLSVLRFSYFHTLVSVAVLFFAYMYQVFNFSWDMPNAPMLTSYFSQVAMSYVVFLGFIALVGAILSYHLERMDRRNWLRVQISQIESEHLKYVTTELNKLSLVDGLTQLHNRRFFDTTLNALWDESATASVPLSVMMVDVDWFREFNYHYGYQKGNDCLKQIAAEVRIYCDDHELHVMRYEGDQFGIILPGRGLKTVVDFAESLTAALFQKNLPHGHSPLLRCTVSVGIATDTPQLEPLADIKEQKIAWFLKKADDALFDAKSQGKNQIAVS